MCLHVAAIHGHTGRDPLPGGQRLQYPVPVLATRPPVEAIVNRGRRAIFRRTVLPAAAALEYMNNPADDTPVINTRRTNGMAGKVWLNRCPRLIRKPENIPHSILQGKSTPWNHILTAISMHCYGSHPSTHHFSRAFRASLGMSPYRYFNKRRITRAKELLLDPGRSLTDIGLSLGFSSHSHFTDTFRKITGLTPSQFRKDRL